jgi:hypothetical protein
MASLTVTIKPENVDDVDQDYQDLIGLIYEELPRLIKSIALKAAVRPRKVSIIPGMTESDLHFIDPFLDQAEKIFNISMREERESFAAEIKRFQKISKDESASP